MGRGLNSITSLLPALVFALHAVLLLAAGQQAGNWCFASLIVAPLLAAMACFMRARREGGEGWLPLGLGMLCWGCGMAFAMLGTIRLGVTVNDGLSMLLFVLYGVPLIFALASHDDDGKLVRLVDAAMAGGLGYLFQIHVTRYTAAGGMSGPDLMALQAMFDMENVYIALFAVIRFATCQPHRKRFFRAIAAYACTYAAVAAYINHAEPLRAYGGMSDLLIDVPFLLLAWLAMRRDADGVAVPALPEGAFARVVRAGGALLIPLTLLTVSVPLVRFDPVMALIGCIAASLGFGLRTVLVQLRNFEDRENLTRLSRIDGLTGVPNRRCFDEELREACGRAAPLGVLMIDIDHFKKLNDHCGHAVGDEALRTVARALDACVRQNGNMVARYGGEEFAAILPDVDCDGALATAERMRTAVEALALPSPAPPGHVTVSIGLACAEAWEDDFPALTDRADRALYAAKHAGRNRVVCDRPQLRPVPSPRSRLGGGFAT